MASRTVSAEIRAQRQHLAQENIRHPLHLEELPSEEWARSADLAGGAQPERVWRSRHHLVMLYPKHESGAQRLSVLRTSIDDDGRWRDGITWDDLQRLKREAGFGDAVAVEIYPPDDDIIDVANLRHLWLLPGAPSFMWRGGR